MQHRINVWKQNGSNKREIVVTVNTKNRLNTTPLAVVLTNCEKNAGAWTIRVRRNIIHTVTQN